jgi:hypothetical protein
MDNDTESVWYDYYFRYNISDTTIKRNIIKRNTKKINDAIVRRRRKGDPKMIRRLFTFDEETSEQLNWLAEIWGMKRSAVIRILINKEYTKEYVNATPPQEGSSGDSESDSPCGGVAITGRLTP